MLGMMSWRQYHIDTVPYKYVSAGYPNTETADMNDTEIDMPTDICDCMAKDKRVLCETF